MAEGKRVVRQYPVEFKKVKGLFGSIQSSQD